MTAVSLSAQTEVNGITFNSGASAFTITVPANNSGFGLNISGVGVTNNSGTTQKFVAAYPGFVQFFNSATAGSSTSYELDEPATMHFYNASNAGSGTFTLKGDPNNLGPIYVQFSDSATAQNGNFTVIDALIAFDDTSTAGSGTFTLNPSTAYDVVGNASNAYFEGNSTAGNATFTINGGTVASGGVGTYSTFVGDSSAGAATLIANAGSSGGFGGSIQFNQRSIGGTSRVGVFGNGTGDRTDGNLDISGRRAAGVSIGSLEGTGSVFLGRRRLTIGSNDLSTTFSGMITDYPSGTGYLGSLRKIGNGKLTLSHSSGNNYDGGTTINKGTLIAANNTGSATGSGPVQVNSGTLSGTGIINGAVTVGNGTRTGAILQPGIGTTAGTLTINNTVTFNPPSGFKCNVNRATTPLASKLRLWGSRSVSM
jgi:autotransporter-associated beta strand protein